MPVCRALLAMQKVVGSNPISRFARKPAPRAGLLVFEAGPVGGRWSSEPTSARSTSAGSSEASAGRGASSAGADLWRSSLSRSRGRAVVTDLGEIPSWAAVSAAVAPFRVSTRTRSSASGSGRAACLPRPPLGLFAPTRNRGAFSTAAVPAGPLGPLGGPPRGRSTGNPARLLLPSYVRLTGNDQRAASRLSVERDRAIAGRDPGRRDRG